MGKSVKQYIKALGYWGFLVAAVLIGDIFGIIQSYLSESGNFILPIWGWWLFLVIILVISPFLAFHKLMMGLVSVQSELKELQDARPSIDVTLVQDLTPGGHIDYIKVYNNGAEGLFRAQIELESEEPSVLCLPRYNGYWKYSNKAEAKILKGQYDLIKVAESKSSPPHYSSIHLEIVFYDIKAGYAHSITTSTYLIGAYITDKNGNAKPMTKWDYNLRVTISSSPELREGIFNRAYILNIDGLREIASNS